jgi:hypothetical protein
MAGADDRCSAQGRIKRKETSSRISLFVICYRQQKAKVDAGMAPSQQLLLQVALIERVSEFI